MSFRLALPRKALTSSSPPSCSRVPERSNDPLQHPQRKPLLTNASTRLQTFDLQHQSNHQLINALDRIGQFFSSFGTERAH